MANTKIGARRYQFGRFVVDLDRGTLRDGNVDLTLRAQSYAVLEVLIEHAGVIVSKEQLQSRVWGGTFVTDDSLTQCIADIRRAMGDSDKKIIRTVPRRGYILDRVIELNGAEPSSGRKLTRWQGSLGVAAGLLVAWSVGTLLLPVVERGDGCY